jgi:hypothetical protein
LYEQHAITYHCAPAVACSVCPGAQFDTTLMWHRYLPFAAGPLTCGQGIQLKMALTRWSNWATDVGVRDLTGSGCVCEYGSGTGGTHHQGLLIYLPRAHHQSAPWSTWNHSGKPADQTSCCLTPFSYQLNAYVPAVPPGCRRFTLFPRLRATADLLMMPKEVLADRGIRAEVGLSNCCLRSSLPLPLQMPAIAQLATLLPAQESYV